MKDTYPKAKEVDICLILEGTYPFVPGGVSNWVYELIRFFPKYRFGAIFLGTRPEDYQKLFYPLPDNLVHLEMSFLFEFPLPEPAKTEQISKKTMKKVTCMHQKMAELQDDKSDTIPELFELLLGSKSVRQNQFLRSKGAWEFITSQYTENHAEQSFYDYFWSVRNLHHPFWKFKKVVENAPKSRVIHSASTGYAGFLGALLHHAHGVPHVLTEHGIYTKERWIDLMRNYFFDKVLLANKTIDVEQELVSVWIKFFTFLGKMAYDSAYPIISLFEGYRERQIQDGALRERTQVISYGIDCHHYHYLGKQKPNQTNPIIACIGRVVSIKDIKTFIRACALIIQQKPSTECWIVGSLNEDPEYVTTCQNLTKILGIDAQVKFLGQQKVMEIYAKIDLLLLTSISEGSPFVMLECLAVGVPVVATNVGGCSELIYGKTEEDKALGAAGELVNLGDSQRIAEAALSLLTNEKAWQSAQQAGVKRIQTYYNMDLLVKNYDQIYQEVML